jgi:hypothetical protein
MFSTWVWAVRSPTTSRVAISLIGEALSDQFSDLPLAFFVVVEKMPDPSLGKHR